MKRVLALSSGGGHWEQLLLLGGAFSGHETHFAATLAGLAAPDGRPVHKIPDCNRNERLRTLYAAVAILTLVLRLRPDVVVTTGALPGVIALAIARRLGARTIWIDSIANAEEMSMAGRHARRHADLWLSQWPAVADAAGATYAGSVL